VVELLLAERREVGAFGQVLAQQAVGVLVDAALPRAVRVGEVDLYAGDFGQLLMLCHFPPLVVGYREAPLRVDALEDRAKATDRGLGAGVVHLRQGYEQRGSLDQRADRRGVAPALEQVAFPVAGNDPRVDLGGPLVDAGHVGNAASGRGAPRPRSPALACLAQARDQFRSQLSPRHGIQRRVDGFVTDLQRRIRCVHPPQYAGDLLRRMPTAQEARDLRPQGTVVAQPGCHSWRSARRWASGARYPPASGGRPRFLGPAGGLRHPLRCNSRLIELGARSTLRAMARKLLPCSRLN